ncbi:MAG: rhodanese-like domain-containing protein [Saprospiraceae bacterium]|jgi:phage shock protein E|nr:rhodanese-like domain-containing protein [Lewinellaceae bacterium]
MDLTHIIRQAGTRIIDVREPYEFEEKHLPGAVNIPLSTLLDHLQDFQEKGSPVVVYCDGGTRGKQAVLLLQVNGFQEVYNAGGLADATRATGGM